MTISLEIDQETQNNLCLKRVLAPIRQTLILIELFIKTSTRNFIEIAAQWLHFSLFIENQ